MIKFKTNFDQVFVDNKNNNHNYSFLLHVMFPSSKGVIVIFGIVISVFYMCAQHYKI